MLTKYNKEWMWSSVLIICHPFRSKSVLYNIRKINLIYISKYRFLMKLSRSLLKIVQCTIELRVNPGYF